jgi:hypothetical protein
VISKERVLYGGADIGPDQKGLGFLYLQLYTNQELAERLKELPDLDLCWNPEKLAEFDAVNPDFLEDL